MKELKHTDLTRQILKAFYTVYNTLGAGFLEKVYRNALMNELRKMRLNVSQELPIKVKYEGTIVGDYFADLIVEDAVIVELKACEGISPPHEAQLLNYLRATHIEVGLLLNFGSTPQFKRKIFTNDRKQSRNQ